MEEIKSQFEELCDNFETFEEKHNKAAGTRARKNAQNLKNLLHKLRKEIQEKKNKMGKKK